MTPRALFAPFIIVIVPLWIATWILATYTVGESIDHHASGGIGFAVSLLAVMAAAYVLFLASPPEEANTLFGVTLVVSGTACIFVALALQWYLASLAADHSRRVGELLGDGLKRGERLNINLDQKVPGSVTAVGYLALFAGVWLAVMGIRIGGARRMRRTQTADLGGLDITKPLPRAEERIHEQLR
jgi:hypothetical protein